MIPMTARTPMNGAQRSASCGRIGMAMRMNAYVPSFSKIAARMTEPTVGAAVWASGSQVCKGHIGTLTANPRNSPMNTRRANVPVNAPAAPISESSTIEKLR